MVKLTKDKYSILLDYVLEIPFNMLMARSVIMGHVEGEIFACCAENPKSFYIVHPYGMTFLCGDSNNQAFNKSLFDYFEHKEKLHALQAYPRDWDNVISSLVDQGKATRYDRLNFKFDEGKFWEGRKQIGESAYEVIDTPNHMLFEIDGTVVPKDYWICPNQFAQIAKAFTVMIDGKPASTAFTSARHDNYLEIGIETAKEHQGKGLAYHACAALVEYCIKNGLEPVWSCRHNNTPSVNLAKKLGFAEVLSMPYYYIE